MHSLQKRRNQIERNRSGMWIQWKRMESDNKRRKMEKSNTCNLIFIFECFWKKGTNYLEVTSMTDELSHELFDEETFNFYAPVEEQNEVSFLLLV